MRERTSHVIESPKTFCQKVCACLVVIGLASCLAPAFSMATPSSEKQAEADAALAQLSTLQADLDRASNEYFTAVSEQEAAQAKMKEAQVRIDAANEKIATLQSQLGVRASDMYRNGSVTLLDIFLGSNSFREFVTNWDLLDQMNAKDASMIDETKTLKESLEAEKAEYSKQEAIVAKKAAEAKVIADDAQALVANMQSTYDSLSAEAAELLAQEQAAQTISAGYVYNNSYSGSEPDYNAVTGNAVVDRAYSYIGNAEYVWGGCSPGAFDCSGFVSYCLTGAYSRLGTTWTFLGWPEVSDPQPGDVATNEGHCGIYIGNGMMIHCATYGIGVIIGPVQGGMTFHRW